MSLETPTHPPGHPKPCLCCDVIRNGSHGNVGHLIGVLSSHLTQEFCPLPGLSNQDNLLCEQLVASLPRNPYTSV